MKTQTRTPPRRADGLDPALREIVRLLADGKHVPEIALITGESERAVKRRVERLKEKLNAFGHYGRLVAVAFREGILEVA